MKNALNNISSNIRQLLELAVLFFSTLFALQIDVQTLFKGYLENNSVTPDNFIWYMAISYGNYAVAIVLIIVILIAIRKINSEFVMNQKHVYHNYCYAWYWICGKILGIKKCNLVLVPIYMQFKLVIRGTFDDYPLNDEEYPVIDAEPDCGIEVLNREASTKEVNIILEDTYVIDDGQIPEEKRSKYTIKISRNDGKDKGRHFSQKFISAVINEVRNLRSFSIVNIYATTNPMNTKHIAKRAFALGDRGNIKELWVFQQTGTGIRKFKNKAYRIY